MTDKKNEELKKLEQEIDELTAQRFSLCPSSLDVTPPNYRRKGGAA